MVDVVDFCVFVFAGAGVGAGVDGAAVVTGTLLSVDCVAKLVLSLTALTLLASHKAAASVCPPSLYSIWLCTFELIL